MSQSSHSVGNVSAPAFRAAMNDSLQALASLNSGPDAPPTTYANMLWYDTSENTLYMRSEADADPWIALGTLNQSTNTFTPAGSLTLASQAEAETGTDNTKVMTPLRVAQSVVANVPPQAPALQGNAFVSRSVNVTFTNSLTRPIFIFASYNLTDNIGRQMQGQVNYGAGLVNTVTASVGSVAQGPQTAITFIVPAGSQYRVNMPSTANTTQIVVEFN